MDRSQKETFVDTLSKNLTDSNAFVLMSFSKLSVEKVTSFRLGLRKKDVFVKVIKNSLAKRVLDKTAYKEMSNHLEGPMMIAFGKGDPVLTTKVLWEWVNKEDFGVTIKGGVALGQTMSTDKLKALSKLPGRPELLTSFVWGLKSLPTKFLYALEDTPRKLGYALSAYKTKKEAEPKSS